MRCSSVLFASVVGGHCEDKRVVFIFTDRRNDILER